MEHRGVNIQVNNMNGMFEAVMGETGETKVSAYTLEGARNAIDAARNRMKKKRDEVKCPVMVYAQQGGWKYRTFKGDFVGFHAQSRDIRIRVGNKTYRIDGHHTRALPLCREANGQRVHGVDQHDGGSEESREKKPQTPSRSSRTST